MTYPVTIEYDEEKHYYVVACKSGGVSFQGTGETMELAMMSMEDAVDEHIAKLEDDDDGA